MRRMIFGALMFVLAGGALPGGAAAQETESPVGLKVRCATGGAHLAGCGLSSASCSFTDFMSAHCGTTSATPSPTPVPDPIEPAPAPVEPVQPPPPVVAGPSKPTQLVALPGAVRAQHDGIGTEWYTLRLNGAYHAHTGMSANVGGTVVIALDPSLLSGSYAATVDACNDTACVPSDAATVQVP